MTLPPLCLTLSFAYDIFMMSRMRWIFTISLIILLLGSLWTPFPAQLIRAIRGLPEPGHLVEKIITQEKIVPKIIHDKAPAVEQVGKGKAWQLSLATPLPDVQLPPFPPVIPTKLQTGAFPSITELARGLSLKTQVNFLEGTSASKDRKNLENYLAFFSLEIKLPNATKSSAELAEVNPKLPSLLKEYATLIDQSKVSPFFAGIYSRKKNELRKNSAALDKLLTRHNFYDTETILEIEHPISKRKMLWIQADMDVVSDGSDGDRLPTMPEAITKSSSYQPSTSYRWKKLGTKENPLLAPWEKRLKDYKLSLRNAPATSKRALQNKITHAQNVIAELKRSSFLIAEYDPFIVIPLGMIGQSNSAYSPQTGDYAIVIAKDKLYPAIVGDAGPRYKSGEASLRIAKEINPLANPYSRPVSDLSISYLVFPHSAEPEKGPIDYDKLQEKCNTLIADMGGLSEGVTLHIWKDLLKPEPKPLPAPIPASAPTIDSLPKNTEPHLAPKTDKPSLPAAPEPKEPLNLQDLGI